MIRSAGAGGAEDEPVVRGDRAGPSSRELVAEHDAGAEDRDQAVAPDQKQQSDGIADHGRVPSFLSSRMRHHCATPIAPVSRILTTS
jgi:hypothetical protein